MVDLAFGLTAVASIFAVVDPIGAVPFFAALTEGYPPADKRGAVQHRRPVAPLPEGSPPADKRAVIQKSCPVALLVLLFSGAVGQWIFIAFSITVPAFQ